MEPTEYQPDTQQQYGSSRRRRRRRRNRRQRPYWDNDYYQPVQPAYPPAPTSTFQPREPIICYRCGQAGHFAFACCVRLDHSRQAYSYQQINMEDRAFAYQQQPRKDTTGLIGSTSEVTVKINGMKVTAFTGYWFNSQHSE
ncbi:Hypothetical predicted protein [Mytilus galloprovincialis]|uniref:CCHC-type domain-containing protein n=1 Tax=Mytilus galloprovincialis TaxID=29158 RepID=A0A8B6HSI1_MYTGA|nr:Hypothetical predicted protein [Mytilus galloprovincialis]